MYEVLRNDSTRQRKKEMRGERTDCSFISAPPQQYARRYYKTTSCTILLPVHRAPSVPLLLPSVMAPKDVYHRARQVVRYPVTAARLSATFNTGRTRKHNNSTAVAFL